MLDKKEVNKLTGAAAKLFNTFLEGQKPSEFLPPHAWSAHLLGGLPASPRQRLPRGVCGGPGGRGAPLLRCTQDTVTHAGCCGLHRRAGRLVREPSKPRNTRSVCRSQLSGCVPAKPRPNFTSIFKLLFSKDYETQMRRNKFEGKRVQDLDTKAAKYRRG